MVSGAERRLRRPGAREELRARYGREAVAARLHQFYTAAPQRPEAPPAAPQCPEAVAPVPLWDRLLAKARQRPGPAVEIALRRAQRAHRAAVGRLRAASARRSRR